MIKKLTTLVMTSVLVILTACDSNTSNVDLTTSHINTKEVKNVAWMREKLPANTFAYARIPSLWQTFFEAKADVFHNIQTNKNHQTSIDSIQHGVVDTYKKFLPKEAQNLFQWLVLNLHSPLELAVIHDNQGSMVPNFLLGSTFKDTSIDQINALFSNFIEQVGANIKLIQAFNAEGEAKIQVMMMPLFVHFNQSNGQLTMLSGLSSNFEDLRKIVQQKQHDPALDEILTYENSVDQSGKNLELWFNTKSIFEHNKNLIPADVRPMMAEMGLDKIKYLWAGTAAKNGKSELIINVVMPDVGFRKILPRVSDEMDVMTAGMVNSVWQIALPSVEQVQQGFDWALSFSGKAQQVRNDFAVIIDKVNQELGVSLSDIFNAYGQKILIVNDEAGTWYAMRIKDKDLHQKVMQKLTETFDIKVQDKKLAGVKIKHMSYSTKGFEEKFVNNDRDILGFTGLFNNRQSGYYQIEGDYVLSASVPQILADRANHKHKIALTDWQKKQMHLNWDHAIFAYGKSVKDAPRNIYHTYLNVLNILGMLTNVEIDLFSLPTARELNLPLKGRHALALESSAQALTLKLSYEYSFIENMSFFEGYLGISSLGILMAYAIPAYQDYTIRSKVISKVMMIGIDKHTIIDHFQQHGRFPDEQDLMISALSSEEMDYDYNAETGEITIYFDVNDDRLLDGKSITYTPQHSSNGDVIWQCDGTVDHKYFTYQCQ